MQQVEVITLRFESPLQSLLWPYLVEQPYEDGAVRRRIPAITLKLSYSGFWRYDWWLHQLRNHPPGPREFNGNPF